ITLRKSTSVKKDYDLEKAFNDTKMHSFEKAIAFNDYKIRNLEKTILALTFINEKEIKRKSQDSNRLLSASHQTLHAEFKPDGKLRTEFKSLFDQRMTKNKCSHNQMCKKLASETGLYYKTVDSFYKGTTNPQKLTLDKIKKWVNRVNSESENNNS
ncbi:22873_t:CDS:2, partial [Dentiscutata erythropus]